MAIIKTLSLIFLCVALLVSGVANAAMLCSMDNGAKQEMSAPCHEVADEAQTLSSDCECKSCVQAATLTEISSHIPSAASAAPLMMGRYKLLSPSALIFQPPKTTI